MKYDAICYFWYNTDTQDIVYVGYHKTEDEHGDYYTASTENPAFHDLWNKGLLERVVFFKGSVEQCISLEHYMLSLMNAKNNPVMFNETNGGGAGCNLKLVSEDMKKLAQEVIDGEFEGEIVEHDELQKIITAEKVVEKVKTDKGKKYYQVAEVYVGEIKNMQRIQIRFKRRHNHHVNILSERMSNPIEARKHINPVVVVVFKNGMKKILDGNHTAEGAIKAKWTTIPVVYVPAEEFNNDFSTMEHFGRVMNQEPVVKEGNSKEDVKRTILSLKEKGVGFDSSEMKAILHRLYDKEYSTSSLSALISVVRKKFLLDQEGSKYNFYNYDKDELENRTKNFIINNPDYGCISQSADRVIFAGIGGVVNSFRQNSSVSNWNNPKGKIFIHYNNIEDWNKRKDLDKAIRDCLKIAKMDWVELEYLPCFYDVEKDVLRHEPTNVAKAA